MRYSITVVIDVPEETMPSDLEDAVLSSLEDLVDLDADDGAGYLKVDVKQIGRSK